MSVNFPRQGHELVDRYRLGNVLGEGASSLVYEAEDLKLDRSVAVKVLKPQRLQHTDEQRQRFLKEARLLAKVAHPNVIPVFDVGENPEGVAFFVMELAGARSLSHELEARGTLSLEETLSLLLPLMGALSIAHDMGIVHRDLKPANIVLEGNEGATRAKLLDFGIAKFSGVTKGDTSSECALGTPAYMAPEQARAEGVSAATDVWAMGVLFFRCLTGRLPFDAATVTGVLLKIVNERAMRFSDACPEIPPRVAIVLDQALEPATWARPQDMREFARRLAQACRQDGVLVPSAPDPRGLPHFAAWLQEACIEQTARAVPLTVERNDSRQPPKAPVETPALEISQQASLYPRRTLVASVVLACVSLVLTIHLLWPEPAPAPQTTSRTTPIERTTEAALGPIAPVIAADIEGQIEAASPSAVAVEPAMRAPQAEPPEGHPPAREDNVRHKARISKPRPPQEGPQLVKEWDW